MPCAGGISVLCAGARGGPCGAGGAEHGSRLLAGLGSSSGRTPSVPEFPESAGEPSGCPYWQQSWMIMPFYSAKKSVS